MKGIRIRPDRRGLRVLLFDLEAAIMRVVWTREWTSFSVADVLGELQQGRDIAYTTVMTTMSQLYEKGLLARRRDGKRYLYRPRMSREDFVQTMARKVLASLPDPDGEVALALLAERVADADAGALARLEDLIAARREELGK